MLTIRQKQILEILREKKRIDVGSLAAGFSMTEASIRLDLTKLENAGYLRRFYGGARIIEPADYSARMEQNLKVKKKLAERALTYIQEGETIFLDSGTSVLMLAKMLTPIDRLTVVTNSLPVVSQVGPEHGKSVVIIGGELNYQEQCCTGPMTDAALEKIYASKAFLGADSVDVENGILSSGLDRVGYVRTVMSHAKTVLLLVDSGKFKKTGVVKIAEIEEVDVIITDTELPPDVRQALEAADVKVDLVEV